MALFEANIDLSGDNPFTVSAATAHGAATGNVTNIWQAILSALVGTYGLIRQFQMLERQIDLAERGVNQAEAYLNIASDAYVNITVPNQVRSNVAFDTYMYTGFAIYEAIFLEDAFRLKEYVPNYSTQEGRTLGLVQAQFDRAARQRMRGAGKYNVGRVAWDSMWFATMAAMAKVDAINHGYRYEESKKITLDGWDWERRASGAKLNEAHAVRVTNGLLGAGTNANAALGEIGRGVEAVQRAIGAASEAYAQKGNFFGQTLGQGGFQSAGQALENIGYNNAVSRAITGGAGAGLGGGVGGPLNAGGPFTTGVQTLPTPSVTDMLSGGFLGGVGSGVQKKKGTNAGVGSGGGFFGGSSKK
jgi:hypothetical protein